METSEVVAVVGVVAAIVGPLVAWLVLKRQFANKRLSFSTKIAPLVRRTDPDLTRDLKIYYRDEELPEPAVLSLVISNTGYTAIENAQVVVGLQGATYLIPGYFTDVPAGYAELWNIERSDAEECTITLAHINPRQVVRVKLLMDELPKEEPLVSCAMPNVECVRAKPVSVSRLARAVVSVVAPQLLGTLRI